MTIATPALIIGFYLLCGVIFASSRYLRGDKQADPFKYALKWPVYIITNKSVSNVVELETEKDLAELRTILFDKEELKIRGYTWDGYDEAHKHLSRLSREDMISAKNELYENFALQKNFVNTHYYNTNGKPQNKLYEYRIWLGDNCLHGGDRTGMCRCIYCNEWAKTYGWVEDIEAAYVLAYVEDKERTQRFVDALRISEQKKQAEYEMSKRYIVQDKPNQIPNYLYFPTTFSFRCGKCGSLRAYNIDKNHFEYKNPHMFDCPTCKVSSVIFLDLQDNVVKTMLASDYETSTAKKIIDNFYYYRSVNGYDGY